MPPIKARAAQNGPGPHVPRKAVDWESDNDLSHPFNWPKRRKWSVTLAAVYVCFIVGTNSTIIAGGSPFVTDRFHVSDNGFPNDYWPVAAWNAGAAIAPLIALPLMEHFGVRRSFLVYYALFTIFIIPQALASNFATLITARVVAGALGSIVQNAVESVIADTWRDERERNLPITLFIFFYIAGFTAGPILGAAIVSRLYWRWMFYIQLIIYAASFPPLYLLLRETRHSVILHRRAKELQSLTGVQHYVAGTPSDYSTSTPWSAISTAIIRPTRLFCTEPVVFLFTAWSAFAFGLVFISTQSIAQVYTTNYAFSLPQTGYIQAALLVGEALGCLACLWQNSYYMRSGRRTGGVPVPEARLPLSIPASFVGLSGGLFWYAWSSNSPSLPWVMPAIGLGLVGFGVTVVVHSVVMYLTDGYVKFAASAIAAEAFGENMLAAFLPLATKKMYTKLGFAWAGSLLGFAALALSFAPILLVWKGSVIRKRSRFLREAMMETGEGDLELLHRAGDP